MTIPLSVSATAVEAVIAESTGPMVVLFKIPNCAPCELLGAALGAMPHAFPDNAVVASQLEPGDVLGRSAHLRLGVRRYPTILFVRNQSVMKKVDGLVTTDQGVYLRDVEEFLTGNCL